MMMMQGLKKSSKAQYPLITVLFTLLLAACLFFSLSSSPIGQGRRLGSSQRRKTRYNDTDIDSRELSKVLKNAAMDDRTVILTTLNEAWASPGSVIDLFLESFHIGEGTEKLLDHLVIVAMDQKAFDRCKSIHPHCFSLTTPGVNFAAEKRFMTPDYLKLMWRRIEFLQTVLELGYNFLFTDADIMWFRDPFPHFDVLDEFTIACDFYTGNPKDRRNRANGGFNFVKSNDRSLEFYKYWHMSRVLYPKSHDQSVFEKIKNDEVVTSLGYKIKYLDTAYFGGFCEPSKDMNKVTTMHANCCVGIERKIDDLRLVLEDWKNFTALSSEEKRFRDSSSSISPWRAPKKCEAFLELKGSINV